jgi:hypothetical protein
MAETTKPDKTPSLIIWTCTALYALGLMNIIYSFTGAYAGYGNFYPAINVLIIIILFAALSGIWSMEKWGLYLFLFVLGIKLGLDVTKGAFKYWELLLLIPAVIFLSYRKKMK